MGHTSGLSSGSVETLNGAHVDMSVSDAGIMVGDANVIISDVIANNGIIHVIDAVILPPTEEKTPTKPEQEAPKVPEDKLLTEPEEETPVNGESVEVVSPAMAVTSAKALTWIVLFAVCQF